MWFKSKGIHELEYKVRGHARRLLELEAMVKQLTCKHISVTFGTYTPSYTTQYIKQYYKKCSYCGKILEEYMDYEQFLKAQIDNLIKEMDEVKIKRKNMNSIRGLYL